MMASMSNGEATEVSRALAGAAFSMFAVQQPLNDEDLAHDGRTHRLSMAAASTPDWFSAAAAKSSSLLEMAPELRGVAIEEPLPAEQARTDLIHMYSEGERHEAPLPKGTDDHGEVRWGLLKEIADLED